MKKKKSKIKKKYDRLAGLSVSTGHVIEKKNQCSIIREVPKWDREHEILDFSFFFLFFFSFFSLGGFLVVSGGFHCR